MFLLELLFVQCKYIQICKIIIKSVGVVLTRFLFLLYFKLFVSKFLFFGKLYIIFTPIVYMCVFIRDLFGMAGVEMIFFVVPQVFNLNFIEKRD